jgi:iron complex outermembrane recepter protein
LGATIVKEGLREIMETSHCGYPPHKASEIVRRPSIRLIAAGLAFGGLLVSFGAMAQEAPITAAQTPEMQEVVVTGTLLARPDAETAEAVTIITTDSLKAQGITTVEQALQQISANQSASYQSISAVSTYTGGGSFADLRSLGASRTLVLLDGQRLANNVTLGYAVDLTGIPFAAIDHVEVLREGASSLYGTDAMAGVINFITKKDYDKGEVNVTLSRPQDSGGSGGDADFTFGKGNLASDGYNFMIAANYTKSDELTAQQRSYSKTGYYPSQGLINVNDPGNVPGSYFDGNGNQWQVGYPACTGNPYLARYPAGNCAYLYSAAVDLIPKSDEVSGLASLTKSLPWNNTLSLQYFWTQAKSTTWGGPSEYGFLMNPGSPYFPTAANSTCVGSCSGAVDLTDTITAVWTDPNDNRYTRNTNTEQRVLLTFAGKNAGWDYAASVDYSKNTNDFAVTGGYANPAVIAPGGYVNPLINPFGPQTQAGQALLNSANLNGNLAVGNLSLWSFNGHAGHELGDAFGAGRPAAFAVGFDVKSEKIDYNTTPLTAILQSVTGFAPQVTSGSRTSQAAYIELNVPMTKQLEFTVSDREDWYSDFGQTNNSKLSFRYQPFSILTFRGAASTGFRAPSLVNIYEPQILGATAGSMQGPGCASGNYTTIFTQSNCTAQGLGVFGGNKSLKPETSENFDLGFVVEPIPDLGITVDYYRVLIKDVIEAIPALAVYQNPTAFANLYTLNSAGTLTPATELSTDCANGLSTPTCGYIAQTPQNTGGIATDGFDINASYLIRSEFGKFRVGMDATAVTQFLLQEYTNGPELNLVGEFNQGNQPVMRWQYLATLDWTSNSGVWGAGLQDRFLSRYADEFSNVAGVTANPREVGTYSIWNGYASVKPIDSLTVLFGIRNLFNTNPPFSNQTANWQTPYNPLFSDPYGRTFYMNLKYQF